MNIQLHPEPFQSHLPKPLVWTQTVLQIKQISDATELALAANAEPFIKCLTELQQN